MLRRIVDAKPGDEPARGASEASARMQVIPDADAARSSERSSLERLGAGLRRTREWASRPALRPWLLAAAAAIFLLLAVGSFRSLPDDVHLRPVLVLVLVLVAVPLTLALNALEYRMMAAALGHRVGFRSALHVSLVASIANYLPAPGGVAVRTAALRRRGSPVRSAISANILAGLVWLGLTAIVSGSALLVAGQLPVRATVAVGGGVVLVTAGAVLMRRARSDWLGLFGRLAAVELATVLISAGRIWIALAAIGQTSSFGSATAISASAVLAALLGVLPAGLGLRELLAGGLATLVDVPAATAIAATALDRVAGQVGMAICAVATGVRWSELRQPTPPS
jgi:uncharacterized membrane protein YbhN (UPF0104 family)